MPMRVSPSSSTTACSCSNRRPSCSVCCLCESIIGIDSARVRDEIRVRDWRQHIRPLHLIPSSPSPSSREATIAAAAAGWQSSVRAMMMSTAVFQCGLWHWRLLRKQSHLYKEETQVMVSIRNNYMVSFYYKLTNAQGLQACIHLCLELRNGLQWATRLLSWLIGLLFVARVLYYNSTISIPLFPVPPSFITNN